MVGNWEIFHHARTNFLSHLRPSPTHTCQIKRSCSVNDDLKSSLSPGGKRVYFSNNFKTRLLSKKLRTIGRCRV